MNARLLPAILGFVLFTIGCAQSDVGITTSIKSRLAADDLVKARQIDVDTRDRVVTLSGTVQTEAEEAKALEIARNTEGVVDVVDHVAVASRGEATTGRFDDERPAPVPPAPEAPVTDASITAGVKARLLADPGISGLQIDVYTRDRIVTLSGSVSTSAQKILAVELASKVPNVARVEDRLTVSARTP